MKMKLMCLSVLIGLLTVLAACGGKTTAPSTPAASTSPAARSSSSAPSSAAREDVTVTGKWELVGKEGEWKGTRDMVGMDGYIWSVEANGSLYKTDPATGKWERSGEGGGWARTIDMVGLNGILYSVEPDGSLWKTDKSGNDTLIDKGSFKGVTHLTAMGGKLWTIEEGTLYQTDPTTLKWSQIGKDGDFANISAMEGAGNFIWMIDKSGNLYKVDASGTKTKLGDSYGETTILTTLNGKLWTVEGGSLYKTS